MFLENMVRGLQSESSAATISSSPGSRRTTLNGLDTPSGHSVADPEYREISDLSSMIGTLSLNAAGSEPVYLGSSSAFAFARFVEPAVWQVGSSMPPNTTGDDVFDLLTPEPCALPDYPTAVKLSNAYFQNIHTQYPFLHEPTFRGWEQALRHPLECLEILNYSSVSLFFLNMVYAVGALLLPTCGYSPKQLYVSALLYINDILCHDNLECIQAILCSATYSLRSSKGTSHWKLAGQALQQCVNLGYHRNTKHLRPTVNQLQSELQKRAFWSAYSMECAASVMLGRPLRLHFQEIDVELPLDIEDENLGDCDGLTGVPRSSSDPPTLMTYAIHSFRVRTLHGCIQSSIYSDLTVRDPEVINARIRELSDELIRIEAATPPPIKAPPGGILSYFMTTDWYQINYNGAVLQLYRFQLTSSKGPPSDEVVLRCMAAAQSTCNSCRRQFIGRPTTYTWGVIYELFLSGLTYLYCLWKSPAAREMSRHDQVSSTCTDCTMVLVIAAERWTLAAPYRDVFEALASRTITMLADKGQGKEVAPNWLAMEHDQYSESLPEWMAGIADSGISSGVDLLLSGLFTNFPDREHGADS